uniref:Uncharacterized protein n=1 Tax=Rhizophora mucronata TaxID=61149 RepID=A0A2P2R2K1_RHIMU
MNLLISCLSNVGGKENAPQLQHVWHYWYSIHIFPKTVTIAPSMMLSDSYSTTSETHFY